MSKGVLLEELKSKIENKRDELNQLVGKDIRKDELLRFSMELDELIYEYYDLKVRKHE